MKKRLIKRKKILFSMIFAISMFLNFSCNKEIDPIDNISEKSFLMAEVELKYDLTTTSLFVVQKGVNYSDQDRALMTPIRDNQSITMRILNCGNMYVEMVKLRDLYAIQIPHETLPDNSPKVHKTILWNNSATLYDKSGKLLAEYPVEIPNQLGVLNKIKESGSKLPPEKLNEIMLSLHGYMFAENLDEYIAQAPKNGIKVSYIDEKTVMLRKPLSDEPNSKNDIVLIIDREYNRLMASRVYDKDQVILTNIYGYAAQEIPHLNSIKQRSLTELPSGNHAMSETLIQMRDFRLKINL
jgi:hypothetical protein